jgi:hypothetical protein
MHLKSAAHAENGEATYQPKLMLCSGMIKKVSSGIQPAAAGLIAAQGRAGREK